MTQLTRFDPNALSRVIVGFDRLFDDMERRFANQMSNNYPPHNIAKTDDNHYEIQLAVTGFSKEEITVQVENNEIMVRGESRTPNEPVKEFIHRGLALRDFERTFKMDEHMKVVSAEIKNGILTIMIEREIPEALKPRIVDIVEVK